MEHQPHWGRLVLRRNFPASQVANRHVLSLHHHHQPPTHQHRRRGTFSLTHCHPVLLERWANETAWQVSHEKTREREKGPSKTMVITTEAERKRPITCQQMQRDNKLMRNQSFWHSSKKSNGRTTASCRESKREPSISTVHVRPEAEDISETRRFWRKTHTTAHCSVSEPSTH